MRVLVLLTAAVWGLLMAPPVWARPVTCSQHSLQEWLPCLDAEAAQATGQLRVTLPPNLPIGPGKLVLSRLAELRAAPLAVVVPEGVTTGQGGTMLLIAARTRYVGATSRLSYLSDGQFSDLGRAKLCDAVPRGTPNLPPGTVTICGLVHPAQNPVGAATGLDLLNTGLAQPVPLTPAPPTSAAPDRNHRPGPSGGEGLGAKLWLTVVLALGVAAALVVLALLTRRRLAGIVWDRDKDGPKRDDRQPTESPQPFVPPAPSQQDEPHPYPVSHVKPLPSGPGLPAVAETVVDRPGPDIAVVRTALHPQGYVEIEQCLRRARWMDPHSPPPRPGQRVRISEVADSAVLHAGPV